MQPRAHYSRILEVIKPIVEELVNADGNIPHPRRFQALLGSQWMKTR